MFEYDSQAPLSSATDIKSANLFGQGNQLFSTDGLQVGSSSWQDNSLHVDTFWNINLVKELTSKARTVYTASLSLIGADGTPQILENFVENNAAQIKTAKIRIPDRVSFDLDEAIIEQLNQGARLVVGITQKAFQQRQGADANFAYGASLDITDAITGAPTTASSPLIHDVITNTYVARRAVNGSDRSLIGNEQFLDGCDFSNQDLSGIDFAKTNDGKVVRVAGVNFHNSILRNTTWGYLTDDGRYSYSQWWSKFTNPEPRANFSYADLGGSTFWLNTRAGERGYGVEFLNSVPGKTTGQITRPDYPIIDHAKVYDINLRIHYPSVQDYPSVLLYPPTRATFIRLKNESDRQVSLGNIVTNVFNPWSTTMKPGETIELTGTTAYYPGDDISFDVGGVGRVVANDPPFKSTYVDINGQRFTDGSQTISIGDTRMRVTYQGDGGPKFNEQKVWDLAFY